MLATCVLNTCYMLAKCLLNACFCFIILCEVYPSTELIIGVQWSEILEILAGGWGGCRPGARGCRPLGEIGCFSTTFLGSDPSKPGIPYR